MSRIIIDFTAIGYFFLIPIGLHAQRKGIPHAMLFVSSWGIFVIGMVMASARLRGYIPDSFASRWAIYIGGIIEVILLATIMVLYIRLLQKEKALAQQRHLKSLEQAASLLSVQVDEKTQQLIRAKEKAENEARIDMLTGLTNRRAFIEGANKYIARAKRNDEDSLYMAMLDIDYFKRVNDTYGHATGDSVLIILASTRS